MQYVMTAVGVLLTVAAQIFVKFTSFHEFWSKKFVLYISLSAAAYCLTFLAQSYVMRFFPLNKISPVMSIATMILIFVSGALFFGEQIATKQAVGILLGVVSIYLILS